MSEISSDNTEKIRLAASPKTLLPQLNRLAFVLSLILAAKILLSIVYEYRWYFPANFEESFFLIGREPTFYGWYRGAFYLHITTGPIAIILAFALALSGKRSHFRQAHRWMGRSLVLLVVLAVAPSGLVMSTQSLAGPIAGLGFAALSLTTLTCAIAAGWFAYQGNFMRHQRWANRCFLCLCSPFILRLMAGLTIVTGLESTWTYRLAAWLSWLGPLTVFELYKLPIRRNRLSPSQGSNLSSRIKP